MMASGKRLENLLAILYSLRICHHPQINGHDNNNSSSSIVTPPPPFEKHDALLRKCLKLKLITSIIPLHHQLEKDRLMSTWVKPALTQVMTTLPIDDIRSYCGDAIGFYFAFLQFYTHWLLIPAMGGLLVYLYQIEHGYANLITAMYALAVCIWSTFFIEYWKRLEARLATHWDVFNANDDVIPRADFTGLRVTDPLTNDVHTVFTSMARGKRYCLTVPLMLLSLSVVVAVTISFLQLEAWAVTAVTTSAGYNSWAVTVLPVLPSVGYAVSVFGMDAIFSSVANWCNDYENHRLEAEYANALVVKLAGFYFINNFGYMLYIAFVKQDIELLSSTLASLLITRQVLGNLLETIVPYFLITRKRHPRRNSGASVMSTTTRASTPVAYLTKTLTYPKGLSLLPALDPVSEKQLSCQLELPPYDGTFEDCLELFVQFGHVTLFAAAYPLASCFALLNNIIEIKSDGLKILTLRRSCPLTCSRGLGIWNKAFELVGYAAVVTNLALIVLTGALEPIIETVAMAWTVSLPTATALVLVALEHLFIGTKMLVAALVPDIPTEVLMAQKLKLAPQHPHVHTREKKALLQHILKLSDLYRSWVASEHQQVLVLQAKLDSQTLSTRHD